MSAPTALGPYRIVRPVGRGGMGVVYEALHVGLNKRVALKVLPETMAGPGRLDRFLREARLAAGLHHTNIVPVFDVGVADGLPYYAMQFIDGRPLSAPPSVPTPPPAAEVDTRTVDVSEVIAPDAPTAAVAVAVSPPGRRFSAADVARYGAQAADGLAYAHDRGIVHRDIKPANLIVDAAGVLWIADFGLAFHTDEETLTADGAILGTPQYMSPEQARADKDIDARTDVFSLGVTLYELATGRRAFTGTGLAELIRQVQEETPPPARTVSGEVPRDLEVIIEKAMAKRPGDRYPSAAALADDLRRYLSGRPILARRISPVGRAWRWTKRNPAVAGLLTAVLVTFAVGTAVSLFYAAVAAEKAAEAEQKAGIARDKTVETEKARADAEAAKKDALAKLADSYRAEARGTRLSRRAGQRFDALGALEKASKLGRELNEPSAFFDRLRTEAIAALALPDAHVTRTFGRWTADTIYVEADDECEWYFITDKKGNCDIRRVADDALVCSLPPGRHPRYVAFGPGKWLGDLVDGRLTVWDLSGPAPRAVASVAESVTSWGFRDDGRRAVAVLQNGRLTVLDLTDGTTRTLPPGPGANHTVYVHPTAPFVALSSYASAAVVLRDLDTGATTTVSPPWARNTDAVWRPDGRQLAVPRGDGGRIALYRFDPDAGTLTAERVLDVPMSGGTQVHYTLTGDRLIGRGWNSTTCVFDLTAGRRLFESHGILGTGLRNFHANRAVTKLSAARVDADAAGPRRFGLWSVADGRECQLYTPPGGGDGHAYVAVSPDGRIVVTPRGTEIDLFEVGTGRHLARVPHPGGGGCYPTFDPEGNLYTNLFGGLFRWPLKPDPADPTRYTLGPPARVSLPPGDRPIAAAKNGDVVAQSMYAGYGMDPYAGGWILRRRPDGSFTRWYVDEGVSMADAAVSPDGKWVAFASHGGDVRVFDPLTGEKAYTTPFPGGRCLFSPGGEWLATAGDDGRLVAVGTWKLGPQLGVGAIQCFAPDGRTAFLGTSEGVIRVVEVATGRELARLEDPDLSVQSVRVSADGAYLLCDQPAGVRAWDLRLIRRQLAALGLDWDAPDLPPAKPTVGPLTVTVVGADRLDERTRQSQDELLALLGPRLKGSKATARDFLRSGNVMASYGWFDLALRDYETAARLDPKAVGPRSARLVELSRRGVRWEQVIEDATVLLAAEPDDFPATVRRGWANVQLGRFDAAADDFLAASKSRTTQADYRAALRQLRAVALDKAGRPEAATTARQQAADMAAAIKSPAGGTFTVDTALNNLAWRYAMPVRGPSNVPTLAVALAREAVRLDSAAANNHNTLGVALYQAGLFREAIPELEASLKAGDRDGDAYDLYPLAACLARLGEPAQARERFRQAAAWQLDRTKANKLTRREDAELTDFRAEAKRWLPRE